MVGWQTPKTDWTTADLVTYEDMNRIGGNLNYLLNGATEETIKEDWTQDDFVNIRDWKAIIGAIKALAIWVEIPALPVPTTELSANNFNLAELAILSLQRPVELRWKQTNNYFNDDIYATAETLMAYAGGGI